MIFSRFLKPSYTDKNPDVRIQAIKDLNPSVAKDKEKLHELAFNDESAKVSIAALEQLNSFVLWLKMSEIAANTKVKSTAEKKVLDSLADEHSPLLDASERKTTVLEAKQSSIVKFGIENAKLCGINVEQTASLIQSLGDDSYARRMLLNTESPDLQLILLQNIDDTSQLQKIARKPLFDASKQWLEAELAERQERIERPKILQRKITLNLSKLNALADHNEYAVMSSQFKILSAEYQSLLSDMKAFAEQDTDETESKFDAISTRINNCLEKLRPAYEEKLRIAEIQKIASDWLAAKDSILDRVDDMLAKVFQGKNDSVDNSVLVGEITKLLSDVEAIDGQYLNEKIAHIKSLQKGLENIQDLPAQLALANKLGNLVASFNNTYQLPTKTDEFNSSQLVFSEFSQQVQTILENKRDLPKPVTEMWEQTQKQWKTAFTQLRRQNDAVLTNIDKKLKAVNGMINQGRFKAAISVFAKARDSYNQIPQSARKRLSKTFEQLDEKVSDLEDLQRSIALPRKPELLAQAQALSDEKGTVNIAERSNEVSRLRSTWISFGRLGTAEDDALNQAFDEAIELAFAPCRNHYAEQQEKRNANAVRAQSILDQLSGCAEIPEDEDFVKAYGQKLKEWSQLGQIERDQWRKLKDSYRVINKPLQERQKAIQKRNAEEKQRLANQAQAIAELLPDGASDKVKALQAKWKTIGFAGKSKDNALWQSFRQANDKVFAQLRENRQKFVEASDTAYQNLNEKLDVCLQQITQISDVSDCVNIAEDLAGIDTDIEQSKSENALLTSQIKKLQAQSEECQKRLKSAKSGLEQQKTSAAILDVFDYLKRRIGEVELFDDALPRFLSTIRNNAPATSNQRLDATIRMEILADIESPENNRERRKALQLKLMASKMQNGEQDNSNSLLSLWLGEQPISSDEADLFIRFKTAFLQVKGIEQTDVNAEQTDQLVDA